jgi:putative membrane protein
MDIHQPRPSLRRGWNAALLCALLAAGCAGERADESASANRGDAAETPATVPAGSLDDAEILAVVRTVNSAGVAAAELATERAAAGDTRQYAQHVMEDHSKSNQQVATLAAAIPPRDNPLSMTLREQGAADIEKLEQHSGEEFDRAFVEAQARMHQQVLDTIDEQLLPAAEDQQLRMLLQTTRDQVAMHLEHAQQLQGTTATGG